MKNILSLHYEFYLFKEKNLMNKIIAIYQKFPFSIKIRSLYFVILTLIATFLEVISITMIMPVISLMLDTNTYQDIFF